MLIVLTVVINYVCSGHIRKYNYDFKTFFFVFFFLEKYDVNTVFRFLCLIDANKSSLLIMQCHGLFCNCMLFACISFPKWERKIKSWKILWFKHLHILFKNQNRNLYENIMLCNTFPTVPNLLKFVHWLKKWYQKQKTVQTFLNQTLVYSHGEINLEWIYGDNIKIFEISYHPSKKPLSVKIWPFFWKIKKKLIVN